MSWNLPEWENICDTVGQLSVEVIAVYLSRAVLHLHAKVLLAADVATVRKGQSLPSAEHSCFQPVPKDSPQDTNESIWPAGDTFWKMYSRKRRKCHMERRGRNKKRVRNNRENSRFRGQSVPWWNRHHLSQ